MELALTTNINETEEISQPSFEKPVNIEQDQNLERKIAGALLIGNSYHTKVYITYKDDEGEKSITTTIWASGNKYLCLKGGIWIPLENIIDIELK
ncbi:MAG: hypothetical protein KJ941_10800 [Bacteroidetes bacterium]|nr:hypothetical protein [Bacteroidota bacterium]